MGAEVGSLALPPAGRIYQLFTEVVVPFEGSVARKRKEEVRNYQITDDEPQKKPHTSQTLRPLCPLSVVRCGGNKSSEGMSDSAARLMRVLQTHSTGTDQ